MNRILRIIILISLIAAGCLSRGSGLVAQTPLSPEERSEMIDSITKPWNDWQTISISGKMRITGVSINPSIKIYMEKDSVIRISLRVPLMGEVGRAEIEGDTILVVNKMKKTYVKDSLTGLLARYPMTIGDVQSLLLGRISLPGLGILTPGTTELVDIYPIYDDQYYLLPCEGLELDGFSYAYLINPDWQMTGLTVIPNDKPDAHVNISYVFDDKEYDVIVTYYSPESIYGGGFILDYPTEGGSAIEPIKLSGKYTRLTFEQFMKSF